MTDTTSRYRPTQARTVLGIEGIGLRCLVDAILLMSALCLGQVFDAGWRTAIIHDPPPDLNVTLLAPPSGLILIVAGWVVFAVSGIYSRGRAYRGRYKALVITQATLLTFLIFGAAAYALGSRLTFPVATAIGSAAVAAVVFLVSARTFSVPFQHRREGQRDGEPQAGVGGSDGHSERVLVIGGGGYIGSALLAQLIEAGYLVRVLDSFMFGDAAIARYLDHPQAEIVRADFRRIDQVVTAMRDVDAVVHLGGIVGDPACALNEELTVEVNLTSTQVLAEIAKAHGVRRFVFASSCSVYGASDQILDERSRLNPVSLYAKTKIASERVLATVSESRFRPTILRFGTVYGISGRARFDLVVNLMTAKAVTENAITVFGPDQWRPFVHVSDVAKAIRLTIAAPLGTVAGQVFNVGSNGQNMTLGALAEAVRAEVPAAEIVVGESDADLRNYRVDFNKIKQILGFEPDWSLGKGIRQVCLSVESGAVGHYSAAEYSNVKWLKVMASDEAVVVDRTSQLDLLHSVVGYHDEAIASPSHR